MENESLYRWVKASERLPDDEVFVATKSSPSELIDERFRLNDKWVSRVSVYHNEEITEWLEPIPESEQDELWKEVFSFSNPPGTDLLKHLISKYHLIKK